MLVIGYWLLRRLDSGTRLRHPDPRGKWMSLPAAWQRARMPAPPWSGHPARIQTGSFESQSHVFPARLQDVMSLNTPMRERRLTNPRSEISDPKSPLCGLCLYGQNSCSSASRSNLQVHGCWGGVSAGGVAAAESCAGPPSSFPLPNFSCSRRFRSPMVLPSVPIMARISLSK